MTIQDKHMGWKLKRLWIPIGEFSGIQSLDYATGGTNPTTLSLSQGTPALKAVTTSEITGLSMDAADEVCHVLPIPWDMDRRKPTRGRIFFQHAAAGADTPIFKWGVKFFGRQDAMTEFVAGADVVTTLPAHTCSTNNPSLEVTNFADLSWDDYMTDTDILAAMHIELDNLGSASADECKVLGVELEYQVDALVFGKKDSSVEVLTNV